MPKLPAVDINDIRSVTDFQRNAKKHVARLRKTKAPMVLTVNGSAAIVVQDAATYQDLLNRVDSLEEEHRFIAAVNEGLADVEAGRTRPFREAFAEAELRLGIRR
ncbi:type II toxin-antitoxin system prevent-host-death family antitoxin [Granulicella sp. 5B5]|uniref:type II toxin-antitoxin system prevent-host-death family antitoxin n=1 Tax=Granulicella sp. 5B5 TaxID=1617967 RepID=UPI0015F3953B|nr:type II toxin-antitoxin system prevent-host-death family antitoxin [Granulicella sp. 5B5]QMV18245.1 type II toxin-antitoxin system prevent-host-death family antitoxin [Granulicella sp. 5B5]